MRAFTALTLIASLGASLPAAGAELPGADLEFNRGISLNRSAHQQFRAAAENVRARAAEREEARKWVFQAEARATAQQNVRRKPGKLTTFRTGASIDGRVKSFGNNTLLLGYAHESTFWEFNNLVITPRFFGFASDGSFVPAFGTTFIDARGTDSVTRFTTTDEIKLAIESVLNDEWTFEYGGSYSLTRDPAADFDTSQSGRGRFILHNKVHEGLSVGLGVEVQSRLFRTPLYLPVIIVDWQMDEVTRLQTGTRSILVERIVTDHLTIGVDLAWEFRQYRLSRDDIFAPLNAFTFDVVNNQVPLPGFSMEELTVPLRVIAKWRVNENMHVTAFGGVNLYREISFYYPDEWQAAGADPGNRLESYEFDQGFFAGIGIEIDG